MLTCWWWNTFSMDHNFLLFIVSSTLHAYYWAKAIKSRTNKRKRSRLMVFRQFKNSKMWIVCFEKYLAKAAEMIVFWFWFNDNKDLNQSSIATLLKKSFTRNRVRQIISLRHDANASALIFSPWHTLREKNSTNWKWSFRCFGVLCRKVFASFSESFISLPLSSNFQSAALVYALFVFLAC